MTLNLVFPENAGPEAMAVKCCDCTVSSAIVSLCLLISNPLWAMETRHNCHPCPLSPLCAVANGLCFVIGDALSVTAMKLTDELWPLTSHGHVDCFAETAIPPTADSAQHVAKEERGTSWTRTLNDAWISSALSSVWTSWSCLPGNPHFCASSCEHTEQHKSSHVNTNTRVQMNTYVPPQAHTSVLAVRHIYTCSTHNLHVYKHTHTHKGYVHAHPCTHTNIYVHMSTPHTRTV